MPVTKNPIDRYLILDRCLRDTHRYYTIEALLEALNAQMSYTTGREVSKRTLQKDLTTLEYEYGVDYDDRLRKQRPAIYRYENPNKHYQFVKFTNKDSEKIQDAIDVLSSYEGIPQYDWARMLLKEAQMCNEEKASDRVEFQNNPDLQGLEHFGILLDAISAKQLLALCYQPYGKTQIEVKFSPIRLKQFNNRNDPAEKLHRDMITEFSEFLSAYTNNSDPQVASNLDSVVKYAINGEEKKPSQLLKITNRILFPD